MHIPRQLIGAVLGSLIALVLYTAYEHLPARVAALLPDWNIAESDSGESTSLAGEQIVIDRTRMLLAQMQANGREPKGTRIAGAPHRSGASLILWVGSALFVLLGLLAQRTPLAYDASRHDIHS